MVRAELEGSNEPPTAFADSELKMFELAHWVRTGVDFIALRRASNRLAQEIR